MPQSRPCSLIFCALVALLSLDVTVAFAASPWESGTQYSFHGTVVKVTKDQAPAEPEKTFDLTVLVAAVDEQTVELCWLLDESGRGGWGWIDRAGCWSLDRTGKAAAGTGPALLYDRGDGTGVIPLEPPLVVAPQALTAGLTWKSDSHKLEVLGKEPLSQALPNEGKAADAWKIATSTGYGHKRIQWTDEAGVVVRLSERVFMGRGDEYELTWQLAAREELAPEAVTARRAEYAALAELITALKRAPRTESSELKPTELAALGEALPAAEKGVGAGPLAKLIAAAKSDLALQSGRASDVADLSAKFEGKPAAKFALDGLAGQKLSDTDLKGQVTVLHFWEYRDEPLREPYGQVGYLEYLYEKRKSDGVRVFGIAVDARLADESKRSAAARSATKLVSFMNLSYPLLLDSGAVLKEFGDPRLLGAQLPLFVVIDAEGKIVHYFVGCYEVDRDAGLKQLDEIVTAALKSKG